MKYIRYYGWRGHPAWTRIGIWLHKLHFPSKIVGLFVTFWDGPHLSPLVMDNLSLTVNIEETSAGVLEGVE